MGLYRGRLFLPAAAESLIKLDESETLVELRLDHIQLGRKIVCAVGATVSTSFSLADIRLDAAVDILAISQRV